MSMIKRQSSSVTNLFSSNSNSNLGQIEEEEDEHILEHLEKHAGSALDQAQSYLEDFQKSKVEILPAILGNLYAQGSLAKKQLMRFFKLQADCGILIKFESEQAYEKFLTQMIDV